MSLIIDNAKRKIDEASYFLMRMHNIEKNVDTIQSSSSREEEYGFLLSAFLNACYSTIEMLRQDSSIESVAMALRIKRRDIYKNGASGGWRTISVHYEPVAPNYEGYIPPPADNILFTFFSDENYTPPSGDNVNFNFGENKRFYLTGNNNSSQNSLTDICSQHLSELNLLISDCEQIILAQQT